MMFVPLRFLSKWKRRAEGLSGSLETQVPLDDDAVRRLWLAASWLLSYPDAGIRARLGDVALLIDSLPAEAVAGCDRLIDYLVGGDVQEVEAEYVETFDTRRRGCLYLTYFHNGDTRRRGMALLEIKEQYEASGLDVSDDELPDHLCYVLEFGAAHDLQAAARILLKNRAGLELLRLHLEEIDSPWHPAIAAVCRTMPPLDGDDRHAIARLAAEGPAEELVGLGDGSEDMPPMDMAPYAVGAAALPGPGQQFGGPGQQFGGPGQQFGGCGLTAGAAGQPGGAGLPGITGRPGAAGLGETAFVPLSDVSTRSSTTSAAAPESATARRPPGTDTGSKGTPS